MKKVQLDVLSDALNLCVIRMPDRQYPGILIQGDALLAITNHAKRAHERARTLNDPDLIRATGNLLVTLEEYLEHYTKICRQNEG